MFTLLCCFMFCVFVSVYILRVDFLVDSWRLANTRRAREAYIVKINLTEK